VPLSLKYIGVFHDVKRVGPVYELSHITPRWKFWHKGDQEFLKRTGDQVFVFMSVFAPTRFTEKLKVSYFFRHPTRGWQERKGPTLGIDSGGREHGWRTFAKLSDPEPGEWRAEVQTSDSRVVGEISFVVVADNSTEPRDYRLELF
jgi:hypothetical protein